VIEIATAAISGISAIFAARAMRYAKPTGNGFAGHVLHRLNRLEQRMDTHLQHHK